MSVKLRTGAMDRDSIGVRVGVRVGVRAGIGVGDRVGARVRISFLSDDPGIELGLG